MKKTITRRKLNDALKHTALPPILQRIYASRGVTTEEELETGLDKLHPYHQLKNADVAAALLAKSIENQERILIVGDFDADGATSSALGISALRTFGARHVEFLVPNRFAYGYGLTPEIVEVAAKWKPDVIITVDNGISSIEGVITANSLGIKVIITDHHLAGRELPAAAAIVNPNQPGDDFPSKQLAGVGVIFYVMLALRSELRKNNWFEEQIIPEPNMSQFLDLVTLGTVADVVPLDKNNRSLVHNGLRRIRAGKCRPGIIALAEVAKRKYQSLSASDLGYAIAPRLNAAGRLDDMALGIECLLTDDPKKAKDMAKELDDLNKERRNIEGQMKEQAEILMTKIHLQQDTDQVPLGLCLYDEHWHQGVVGILASRIKDKWHRPVIAFAKVGDNELKGSARSVPGFHIRDALDAIATKHPGLITKFGGHAMAAGLSLSADNIKAFSEAFVDEAGKHLNADQLRGEIITDGDLTANELTLETAELLRNAGPFGQHFPEPVFDGLFKLLQQTLVGTNHLKMVLGTEDPSRDIEAIAFNVDTDKWPNFDATEIKIAYRLDINEYRGNEKVQLIVEYIDE